MRQFVAKCLLKHWSSLYHVLEGEVTLCGMRPRTHGDELNPGGNAERICASCWRSPRNELDTRNAPRK